MWSSRNLAKSCFLSRIKSRTFATKSEIALKNIYAVNGCFLSRNNDNSKKHKFVGPILAPIERGIITSKLGNRCMSTESGINFVTQYLPVHLFQDFALWIHSTTNLPWWLSIILYSTILRTSLSIPIAVYQEHLTQRLKNINVEIEGYRHRIIKDVEIKAIQNDWSKRRKKQEIYRLTAAEKQKLYIRDNCHPSKTWIMIIFQIILFACQTAAINNLCHMLPVADMFAAVTRKELSVGGFGWIKNLTIPDQYYVLPIFTAFTSYAVAKSSQILYAPSAQGFSKIIQKVLLVIPVTLSIIFTSLLPAAASLNWIACTVATFSQILLFALPKTRRLLGLPKGEREVDRPISKIIEHLKQMRPFQLSLKSISSK